MKRHIVPIERLHKLETKTGPLDRGLRGGEGDRHHGGRRDVTIALSGHRAGRSGLRILSRKRINEIVVEQREERRETDHGRE